MNEKQAIQTNTKQGIEEYVTFVRLGLYNQGLSCGAKAIRERLDKPYWVKPLPSVSTICRILSRCGLTHGRTGFYE
jgi:hypothetical protein